MPTNPKNQPASDTSVWEVSSVGKSEKPFPSPRARTPKGLFLFIATVVLIGAAVGYYVLLRSQPGPTVGLDAVQPPPTAIGAPFQVSFSASNLSGELLQDATVSVVLPEGLSFVGKDAQERLNEKSVGDIAPGIIRQETVSLLATSGAGTVKTVDITLRYTTPNSPRNRFEKHVLVNVVVGEPTVRLKFDVPKNIFNNRPFELSIIYENTTDKPAEHLALKLDLPPFLKIQRSQPILPAGASEWPIESLPAHSSASVSLTATVSGPPSAFFNMTASLMNEIETKRYLLNTQSASVSLTADPLSVSLRVNGSPTYISHSDDTLHYSLTLRNNSTVSMRDVVVTAKLKGRLFNLASIESDGSLNSLNGSVNWSVANSPQLASIAPNEEKQVTFTVYTQKTFPITRSSDKNFTVDVEATAESPTVPPETQAPSTITSATLSTKIAGFMTATAKALLNDAASGIANQGPYPPKVNTPTQYTVHWVVGAVATDLKNVTFSGYLQSNSRWTGKVKSTVANQPVYNPNTGQVTWTVPTVAANTGVVFSPIEAIFQIETTPGANQLDQHVKLLSETKVQGDDVFTAQPFSQTLHDLNTSLPDDKTIQTDNRRVTP